MLDLLTKTTIERRGIALLFLAIFSMSILFFNLGQRTFWEPDEGRYAEVTREMIESGNWLTPHLNYIKHFDKPVLTHWLIGSSFVLFGQNEFAGHLPLSLVSLLGVFSVFALGSRLFSKRVGFLSAIILISALGYAALSRLLSTDIVLASCVFAAYLFFAQRRFSLFYVALALGFMAKGPIVFLLTLIPILVFLIYTRDKKTFLKMRLGWGLLLWALLALPWYIHQMQTHPGLFKNWIVQQTYSRVVRNLKDPVYFFIPVIFILFFPQIFFVIAAIKRYLSLKRTPSDENHKNTLLLFFWFTIPFVFFSSIGKKLVTYMLPLLPPLAILTARLWDEALEKKSLIRERIFRISFYAFFGFLSLLFLGSIIFLAFGFDQQVGVEIARPNIIFLSLVFGAGLLMSYLSFSSKNTQRLFWTLTLTSVFFFGSVATILPKIEKSIGKSVKELALIIKKDLNPEDKIVNYRCFLTSLPFYTSRRTIVVERQRNTAFEKVVHWRDYILKDKSDLYQLLNSDEFRTYCVTYTWEFEKIRDEFKRPLYFLAQAGKYVLFSNEK